MFREIGDFLFIVHAPITTVPSIVQSLLKTIVDIFEFLFGGFEGWDEITLNLVGVHDIMKHQLDIVMSDPGSIIGGIRQVTLDFEVCERLDKLLAYMESVDGVCGNGSMLLLGNAVLQSRFPLTEARLVDILYQNL
ncbi:hypothetical protein O9G_003072 [Rozella allomycis CSF55]|uniref:Uncharacterized protein n=1 Tax=Rozella allomycis (strain CSF55) TaxID=988480 RepID=A0A075AQG4_ROZAC|nr:hypothetical protein O9G_003072 [Rozella allomycis CSF55]|eukprot:EPZ30837.1 hypothetical protein O9G_003072 [Rozella allomycis CSF55]